MPRPQVDSFSNGEFKGHTNQTWEGMKPGDAEVEFGFTLGSSSAYSTGSDGTLLVPNWESLFVPHSFKINGKDCEVTNTYKKPPPPPYKPSIPTYGRSPYNPYKKSPPPPPPYAPLPHPSHRRLPLPSPLPLPPKMQGVHPNM